MKKRILIAFSALIVFGLFAAVYAYNRSATSHHTADSCCAMANCCEDGKCKMGGDCCAKHKQETASAEKKDSCCGSEDCCKDGKCSMGGECCKKHDSCPMKDKENTTAGIDMSKVVVAGEAESCCTDGASCCNGGACCKKEKSAS